MKAKTKTSITPLDKLARTAQQAGVVLMTAAVTIGMLEVPEDTKRIVVPNQPAFAFAENDSQANNPIRRERETEETAPHYISYSVAQRTHGRAGTR